MMKAQGSMVLSALQRQVPVAWVAGQKHISVPPGLPQKNIWSHTSTTPLASQRHWPKDCVRAHSQFTTLLGGSHRMTHASLGSEQ
jgi:hypothetical protein